MSILSQTGAIAMNVDLVYCIDGTSSMGPFIGATKEAAKKLYDDICQGIKERSREINELRLKVIVFRDFSHDGEDAIQESDFFNLPDQTAEYEKFLDGIEARGGGPIPESSLEALHLAMKSDWVKSGQGDYRRRHVIVLFTDAPARRLDDMAYRNDASRNDKYPTDTPKNLNELMDNWDDPEIMDPSARRLIILAPDDEPWNEMGEKMNQCQPAYTNAGNGLTDVQNEAILKLICESIVQAQQ